MVIRLISFSLHLANGKSMGREKRKPRLPSMKPVRAPRLSPLTVAYALAAFTLQVSPSLAQPHLPPSDHLQGPVALLEDLRKSTEAPHELAPAEKLRKDLKAYADLSRGLSPGEAADKWLALADRETFQLRQSEASFGFREILEVLPPVSGWDELAAAIDRRPLSKPPTVQQAALRLLGARLMLDSAAESRAKEQMVDALFVVSKKVEGSDRKSVASMVESTIYFPESDPAKQLEEFARSLSALEHTEENPRQESINVPDLVTLVGRDAARPLLRRVLLLATSRVNFSPSKQTLALAREMALQSISDVKAPHWNLCDSLGAGDLFAAMEKRFPRATGEDVARPDPDAEYSIDDGYATASAYYMFDLILARNPDEASRRAALLDDDNIYSGLTELSNEGRAEEISAFLSHLLAAHPELPLWDSYIRAAAEAGHSDEALAELRSASLSANLAAAQRYEINRSLAAALLAAEKVDEGVSELRRTVAMPWPLKPAVLRRHPASRRIFPAATQLVRLGGLLSRPSLIDEATAAVKNMPPEWATEEVDDIVTFATALVQARRYSDAEQITNSAIRNVVGQELARGPGINNGTFAYKAPRLLSVLVDIYSATGRSGDVLLVLDGAPYWNQRDVAGLSGNEGQNIAFQAAEALAATGKMPEARRVLDYVLSNSGGYDPAYALMIKLYGADAAPKLDALAISDRFEERPLLWKAELLRRSGHLAEAEVAARKAIAIDPSDGEEPHGDRMRAYSVLADVLAARGDAKQSEFYRSVVKAIRLSEKADDFHTAGLLRSAIGMYKQALEGFSDAYCIQSRLAVQLNDLGRFDEAAEHYRKAYELMPDSFGRVESHCFGCERAFGPEKAQAVAEQVFNSLAKTTPGKPQVHYLLGYLRTEQDRNTEAFPEFERAVKLDPDYLNAWKKILELDGEMFVADADRDVAVLNILRLDPYERHSGASVLKVHDLRGIFSYAEKMRGSLPVGPDTIYLLRASVAKSDQMQKEAEGKNEYFRSYENAVNSAHPLSAHDIVESNHFLQGLGNVMDMSVAYGSLADASQIELQ
jgi:tetratricopeptide (TPR) repeat protein